MSKSTIKPAVVTKPRRGRPPKPHGALKVETTVAMGCTYEEREELKLAAIRECPPASMSNLLRAKIGLETIKQRGVSQSP